jgi:energy-coupling factor transporter ATP-binding protein EcfA2
LDQNSVRWFQEYLLNFRKQGGTLLLVTHQLELGLELATRVLLLSQRKILKDQSSSTVNLPECQQWLSQS